MTIIDAPIAPTPLDLRRYERESGVEFAHGHIVEKPVSIESSEVELTIGALLRSEAARTKSARVFGSSMGYKCFPEEPARFRKPDVSLVRADRLAGVDPQDGFIYLPPDLAVEVISPSDLAYDMAEKTEEYLRNGFPLVWIVYPNTRTVSIHRADGSVSLLHEADEISGEAALPEFKCRVSEFFSKPV